MNGSESCEISYENENINGKNQLTKEQTQQQPTINIKQHLDNKKYLTLVMIDPDAPSGENPITGPFIHWILANFKANDGKDGQPICAYTGPGPRAGTGRHRYMFLIYQSDEQVKQDRKFDTIPERRKFPMATFVENNHLTLIYQTLFTVDA
ncbi:unnamed protein product [Adineta ricciae]|uniref:Phosphatidylethanolamine-binding protein-like protein n=1 Tax=Adineta ricciae TaxID=249248 RepID=A0A815HV08_ADIRI|nr:unnamed protein product [Adineta ricciae]